jgi:hypothetical protein
MKEEKIDDKEIIISPATVAAWGEACKRFTSAIRETGIVISPEEIGEEEFWLREDGELVIRAQMGPLKAELVVPKGHWARHN